MLLIFGLFSICFISVDAIIWCAAYFTHPFRGSLQDQYAQLDANLAVVGTNLCIIVVGMGFLVVHRL